ncbi:MAG: histidine ammonia-lyase [Paraglaciecola sp.]|jgi:histidine ammonia-lyase
MSNIHHISPKHLTLSAVETILKGGNQLKLSSESTESIQKCRDFLDAKIAESDKLHYGINTGFGSLCNVRISEEDLTTLQHNLVMSHACGTGDEVPQEVVKIMLFLKIQSLSYGHSGIRMETIQKLMDFYNYDILPVIFQLGSLGASGDLAPLAHLSLPLIGLGEVYSNGRKMPTQNVLNSLFSKPIRLGAKEGLALLNGTQFSAGYGVYCMIESKRLYQLANLNAAISADAFNCRMSPYDKRLHDIRPHQGQIEVARFIRTTLRDSDIAKQEKTSVQDPYAFRCVPQVHGASKDAIDYIEKAITTEINSVTDNPNLFPEDGDILSGGNFHAQPLALPLDFLAIALAELGSISERRVYQLISGQRDLPAFLVSNPGLNSGLMIAQYSAASIVSQNKQLCTPASVDSIVSCNGQEDHVSMAANAATKAYRVVKNLERLLAIEFMTAAQALEFRRPLTSSPMIESLIENYRKVVPVLEEDRVISKDIEATIQFLKTADLGVEHEGENPAW